MGFFDALGDTAQENGIEVREDFDFPGRKLSIV